MSDLNICIISWEYPPFFWAGGEGVYTAGLCSALSKLGNKITVLTTDLGKHNRNNTGALNFLFIPTIKKRPLRLLSFWSRSNAKIKQIAENMHFDVVHYTYDYCGPIITSKEIKMPIITTMHHPYFAEKDALSKYGHRDSTYYFTIISKSMLAKITCNRATKIIAVSKFTAEGIIKRYGISPEKITVIPNAIDTARFHPKVNGNDIRERWNLNSYPVIVYVGRLVQNKGLHNLIEAFANVLKVITDAKLIIVGEEQKSEFIGGGIMNELLTMSKRLNLDGSIKFVGKASAEDLPKIYAASDLFVLPSLLEGFGMVLLEAMATEKPCIATIVGGIPEAVIHGKTGILVPKGDTAALSEAICTLLSDKSLAKRLGKAGRQRVEKNFTWDVIAQKTNTLYEETLSLS
jgi:glycosyltransferase involved in cell wall biosynthesis